MASQHIVIGSGPAGLSCAKALLAEGHAVLMIDAGNDLEPERAAKLVDLRGTHPDTWSGEPTAWLREDMQAAIEGIPLKLCYGSDYPYRSKPGAPVIEGAGVNTKFSLGKGGLSAVWGAAAMPYRQQDMVGWPITAGDLAPHYRSVLDFMPVAQVSDGLEEQFPTFKPTQAMPLSAQARALLGKMQKNRPRLESRGVTFGTSRLAVRANECIRCGLCMYGCPFGLIYSTAQTVDLLLGNPAFDYLPGHVVQRVGENADGVKVTTINSRGEQEEFAGDRVFVGAGVLASASLMLRSLDAYGEAVTFKESHYFLLPMLRFAGVPEFHQGDLHTLAQLFVEVLDPALSPFTIHLQTYTYNDLFKQPIAQMLGAAGKLFPWKAFLQRLYLFQGYLHSDHSPLTEGRLERLPDGDVLRLVPTERAETSALVKKLIRKLMSLSPQLGMMPLGPLLRPGEPGRGFHTGGSFPMAAHPSGLESDILGRPAGLKRIHLVDSSVLPSIPATTITYTVMANAHRIGTLAGKEA